MELYDLKTAILENNIPEHLIVFVCNGNHFLANQYIEAICTKLQKEKRLIKSIFEQQDALSLVFDYSNTVNVLKVEIFEEYAEDYSQFENTIVVCDKIDKKLDSLLSKYLIKVPTLEAWQIEDYIKQLCPELDILEIGWLLQATKQDIYQIDSELSKVCLFKGKERKEVFNELRFAKDSYLYNLELFTLSDALIYNNKAIIIDYLKHRQNVTFELLQLVGNMLQKVKNLLFVNYTRKTAVELGISSSYYNFLSKNSLPLPRVQNLIQVLSKIDQQLKSGLLDIPLEYQIDYLISKVCI